MKENREQNMTNKLYSLLQNIFTNIVRILSRINIKWYSADLVYFFFFHFTI